MSEYTLKPLDQSLPQSIQLNAYAHIFGSDSLVNIASTDSFYISASLCSLSFDYVTGIFNNTEVSFDSLHQDIDLPTGFEGIELVNAQVSLEIENGFDMGGGLDIRLVNSDNSNELNMTGDIATRGLASSATTTIVVDSVSEFLSPYAISG